MVTLPLKTENGVRPGVYTAIDHSREMNSEKRKLGIGHRIDQIPDQIAALRFQFVILTSKWHNARARVGTGHFRHSVTLQARAIDNQPGGNSSLGGLKICTTVIRVKRIRSSRELSPPTDAQHAGALPRSYALLSKQAPIGSYGTTLRLVGAAVVADPGS